MSFARSLVMCGAILLAASAPASAQILSGTKTVSGTFLPGDTITYTVTITNGGPLLQADNPGDEFTDVLPVSLVLVSASATSGTAIATIGTNTVSWNGAIAAFGSTTVTITATISGGTPGGTTVSNQGTMNYDTDGNGTNESSAVTDDPGEPGPGDPTSFVVSSPAVLSASMTAAGTFAPGASVTYTVVVANTAGAAQLDNPGDEFSNVLPAALTLVSATASSGTAVATPGTNTVTWNGSIAGGDSVTLTITATVDAATSPGTSVSNQGTVNFDGDGNGTNESSELTDDPGEPGASDPTVFIVVAPVPLMPLPWLLTLGAVLSGIVLYTTRRATLP